MKLKKISIMTFAALYATGIGTLVANPLDRNQADTMGNTTITTDLDGTDWYAGVRFSYQFSDAWSVGLGYQYLAIEPNDLLSYQLNLRYQF